MFISLVAHDGVPVIEVDVKFPDCAATAPQAHINNLQIALPPIQDFKGKPHRPFVAIVALEIAAIQTELREVSRVEVVQIVQRVNTATLFGPALPELEMKMG